ncbi:hypothetical protein HSBAA_13430 [Vreelandella sulfidaeris]|uniref:FAD/NAD(P)-binding domain-containing protein n=1 Tax=Vreelandella sulfidaeris TaxID=115553 RepID=A0A455U300_9GAMM|nr:hypothetical protein HSBAA_13430 [Halomonas sulfidaeris]
MIEIDRSAQEVVTDQGRYPYDRLVLATGSFPFVPPIPGNDRDGCLVYRTLDDLDAIQAAAENATTGVVVGGGLLGLEAANALRGLNLDTAVVEFASRLMPMQVDNEGGELLREKLKPWAYRCSPSAPPSVLKMARRAVTAWSFKTIKSLKPISSSSQQAFVPATS